jgi:hypothetical protein
MTRKYHVKEEKLLVSKALYYLQLKLLPMIIAEQEELERIITETNISYSEFKRRMGDLS